jgi:hypothetical protein
LQDGLWAGDSELIKKAEFLNQCLGLEGQGGDSPVAVVMEHAGFDTHDNQLTSASKCIIVALALLRARIAMDQVRFSIDGVTYHSVKETEVYRRSGAWIWSTLGWHLAVAQQQQRRH